MKTPYRANALPQEESSDMNYVLIRWVALTMMLLIICGFGTCILVNRHSDDATVAKAQADSVAAQANAERAKSDANKSMWEHMKSAAPCSSSAEK